MYFDEYGSDNEQIIVMLHGANFVHCFKKQYVLAEQYHIIVPHLMGYGKETDKTFHTDEQIAELTHFILSFGKKVMLVGFSLGAQIGYRLVSEHPELFSGAVLISPWLIKDEQLINKVMKQNMKQLAMLKRKMMCRFVAKANGLSSDECREFVAQMQNVTEDTVRNAVDNGIVLENVKEFEFVEVPILALAGQKEDAVVTDSVRKMADVNDSCRCQIWDKAGHDIPFRCAERLNELIENMMERKCD